MRIAVIADTHNHLPSAVALRVAGADEIWHLGDVCSAGILGELKAAGPPVFAVRGNCDPRSLGLPETLLLERGGWKFYLVHEPTDTVPAGADFVLHGHTHVPRDETRGHVRFMNPGTVSKPNHGAPPSFAWLEIPDDGPPHWTVERLD